MNKIGSKCNMTSSNNRYEQEGKEAEPQNGDEMEIVEVLVTDTVDSMSVRNATTVNICVLNNSDYHTTVLFVRIERIENPETSLRDN